MFPRKPYGVVLILAPFNAPVALAAAHLMPALVAGNTAVVKVPLLCPLAVTAVLGELAASLPDGVLNVVAYEDATASELLVGDRRVRKIGLTGGALSLNGQYCSAVKRVYVTDHGWRS